MSRIRPASRKLGELDDQETPGADSGRRYYQLTHDYLVLSLLEWLVRKQKETRRGRAELRLAERSALWNAKPENRHLPAWWEWTNIRCLADKRHWSEPERKMMNRAGRVNAVRFSGLLIVLGFLGWAGFETYGIVRGSGLLASLTTASIEDVPGIVEELIRYRRWTNTELRALANETNTDADTRLHASLALLRTDASQLPYLKDRLLDAEPEQVDTIRLLLATHKDEIVDDLWHVVEEGKPNQLLQAASALAFYDADNDAKWLVVRKWLSILTTICPVDRAACVRGWTRLQPSAIFGAVQRSPLCWRND